VLACVALSAHIAGDPARARAAALALGARTAEAVAAAVARAIATVPADQLAGACRAVCAASNTPLDQLRRLLFARGIAERRCRALAESLADF